MSRRHLPLRLVTLTIGVSLALAVTTLPAGARYGKIFDLSLGGPHGRAVGLDTLDRHVGPQRLRQTISANGKLRVEVRIARAAGSPATYASVTGCEGRARLEVRYRSEGRDITDLVAGAGFETRPLARGEWQQIHVRFVARGFPTGATRRCDIRTATDTVRVLIRGE